MIPQKAAGPLFLVCLFLLQSAVSAQDVKSTKRTEGVRLLLSLENPQVVLTVAIDGDRLESERFATQASWAQKQSKSIAMVETDADFSIELMWSGARARMAEESGSNPVVLSKADFTFRNHISRNLPDGSAELHLRFAARNSGLALLIVYHLEADALHYKRRLSIADSANGGHFVQHIASLDAAVLGRWKVVKAGGLGQPAAMQSLDGSVFFALEYPAAVTGLTVTANRVRILCKQEIGERLSSAWLSADWLAVATTPDYAIKRLFLRYIERARPPVNARRVHYHADTGRNHAGAPTDDDAPSERSVRRDLQTLKRELVEKRGVKTDAIVIEGGWYDQESEWLPHTGRFPRGLALVAGFLKDEGIALGLAVGREFGCPYSDRHLNWMSKRGYEIIRAGADDAAFCIAGEYYGKLLGQRLAALTDSDGVGVFSLGGFHYSCSEPDHGHAPGIFSRRAVVQSITRVADIVRSRRADVLLELASDAWLSPFWLKRFDHVRSGDVDSSLTDLPAPEPRYSAISSRDALMYKALRKNDAWFPLRNLTPGCVKGSAFATGLRESTSPQLFADDVMMEIARGSSLHRLNMKTDEMSERHWDALASALRWASDRFSALQSGEMVGGDPAAGECYGYMHSDGQHSILFARNPWTGNGVLRVPLAHSLGVSSSAEKLVLEQVYPERLVVPRLFRSGEMLNIPLNPWETAVYEIYPLEKAVRPLVAGVPYTFMSEDGGKCAVILHDRSRELTLLNPELVRDVSVDDAPVDIRSAFHRAARASSPLLSGSGAIESAGKPGALNIRGTLDPSVDSAFVELLLAGDGNSPLPTCLLFDDGRNERRLPVLSAKGRYMWLRLDIEGRAFSGVLRPEMRDSVVPWKGRVSAWVKSSGTLPATRIVFTMRGEIKNESMPPVVNPPKKTITRVKLGDADLQAL